MEPRCSASQTDALRSDIAPDGMSVEEQLKAIRSKYKDETRSTTMLV